MFMMGRKLSRGSRVGQVAPSAAHAFCSVASRADPKALERLTRPPSAHRLREPIESRGDLPPIAATLKNELKRERARRPSRSGIFCIHTTEHPEAFAPTHP